MLDEQSVSEVSGDKTHTRWMSRGYNRRERKSRNISLQEEINYILEGLYKLDQEDLRYKLVVVWAKRDL